jgi:hypothetical protein
MENNSLLQIIPNKSTGEIAILIPNYSGTVVVEIYSRQNALVYELSTDYTTDKLVFKPSNLVSASYRIKITTELLHWEQTVEL